MNREVKDAYHSWKDSLLAARITDSGRIDRLNAIWGKANEAYPRATWKGWVDHSATHILSVLRNLDRLIPGYVYETISEPEAFVLVAATLLHDIGMIPEENVSVDLQYFANLRLRHGRRGEAIVIRDFCDFLTPHGDVLFPVCEIIKNHHGDFKPIQRAGLPYDLRADALWVRLADELDFGSHRAPAWLLEYIRPDEDEFKHWRSHNQVQEPAIDLEMFRIQVVGTVENESLIRKLRVEFETPDRQDLQKIFLGRGLGKPAHNRTFLIWDLTEIEIPTGEDSKEIDARPAIFSNEQFLLGGRYLYRLGRFDMAKRCFEDGVNRLSGRWSDMPATPYFYHYLKTLHALGDHQKALEITEQYMDADFSAEIRAAMAASNGLGHWKLGEFTSSVDSLRTAAGLYGNLSHRNVKHKINEADAWVLYSIVYLERIRASKDIDNGKLIRCVQAGLNKAEKLLSEFEREKPEVPETHYKGRYWGLRAFFCLLQIDLQSSRDTEAWAEALEFAKAAHGGEELADRTPFGAMCGKYCAAAVRYHKYENCDNELDKQQALLESARAIKDVRQTYDDLFGPTKRIFRLWPKIHRLFVLVQEALPGESKGMMSGFYGSGEPSQEIQIYTPLH